ncbi:glucose 1-dehydrogenase [Mycobacteroides franklinii]|jgi:NAD(P)-dependent dehydrogenase (short-subunit alcohol dehydrogenase family)|uniref:glucose 1-dehydrogenase n=1 Tax=Mycobacteroides franklinii TaxID=948102 RepID=UPI0013E89C52|nr:MFS transporter [Mycobacteroides franklinii]
MSSRVVVVTGALTGIGRATAEAFADIGDVVVVAGRHRAVGEELAMQLNDRGAPKAVFVETDVRFEDQVAHLVETTVGEFGSLDVAVNSAGLDGELGLIRDVTVEQYRAIHDTNVLGTLLSLKHQLRAMQKQRSGAIVNVSSLYGLRGTPNVSVYAASKHAVIGLTRTAALEAAEYGVRVNAVAPGYTDTPMLDRVAGDNRDRFEGEVPLGRIASPAETALAITYLSGPGASYVTGQVLPVDGGLSA